MNNFFDFLFQFSDFLLLGLLLLSVVFFMSLYFKKRTVIITGIILIFGSFFMINQLTHTTFNELSSKQLNEKSIVRSITITINDLSDHFPERKARVTIKDEEMIKAILDDFSDVELKKDADTLGVFREYYVSILTSNQKENYLLTSSFSFEVDHEYLNNYEIVSESNHLKTIDSLVNSENVEWNYYN